MIIVGNGPSVLQRENGHLIDQFETVVRFNNFETEGYEKHTGTKTDILFTTTLEHYNNIDLIYQFKEVMIYLHLPEPEVITEVKWAKNIRGRLDCHYAHFLAYHCKLRKGCWPSTGLAAICLYMAEGRDVTITGFDNFEKGFYYEYYKPEFQTGNDIHDWIGQRRFINKLIKTGKIKVL